MDNKYQYFVYGFFMGNMAVAIGLLIKKVFIIGYFAVLIISVIIMAIIETREAN